MMKVTVSKKADILNHANRLKTAWSFLEAEKNGKKNL